MIPSGGIVPTNGPSWIQRALVTWCGACAQLFDWAFILVCLLVSGRLWQALVVGLALPGWLALRRVSRALLAARLPAGMTP